MPDKTAIRQAAAFAGVIALRIILGGYFILSGLYKIQYPGDFALEILKYRIVGDPWIALMALSLPWLELFAGVGVVVHRLYAGSLLMISGMLVVFIIALGSLIARNMDNEECGCGFLETTPALGIARNLVLLTIAVVLGVIDFFASRRKTA